MSVLLGLMLVADIGLRVQQVIDVSVEEVAAPLVADLALAIERRVEHAIVAHDPSLLLCRGAECLTPGAPNIDEVLVVQVVGGVRRILLLVDRVRVSVQPPEVVASLSLELEPERERWRAQLWIGARTLFPDVAPLQPAGPSPSSRLGAAQWATIGGATVAAVVGATLLVDGGAVRSRLLDGTPGLTVADFEGQVGRARFEATLGGALLSAGVSAAIFCALWAVVPSD